MVARLNAINSEKAALQTIYHLDDSNSDTPDVYLGAIRYSLDELGRHVVWSSRKCGSPQTLESELHCGSKVRKFHRPISAHQNIVGLNIPEASDEE